MFSNNYPVLVIECIYKIVSNGVCSLLAQSVGFVQLILTFGWSYNSKWRLVMLLIKSEAFPAKSLPTPNPFFVLQLAFYYVHETTKNTRWQWASYPFMTIVKLNQRFNLLIIFFLSWHSKHHLWHHSHTSGGRRNMGHHLGNSKVSQHNRSVCQINLERG